MNQCMRLSICFIIYCICHEAAMDYIEGFDFQKHVSPKFQRLRIITSSICYLDLNLSFFLILRKEEHFHIDFPPPPKKKGKTKMYFFK